jgi:hypothetical protein
VLDLFFLGGRRYFASVEPDLELGLLFVVQLQLVLFAVLDVVQLLLLLVCLGPQSGRLDHRVAGPALHNDFLAVALVVVLRL